MPLTATTDPPDQVLAITVLHDDQLYTIAEVSKASRIPERTIRAAVERGVIPVVRIPGIRRYRITGRAWKKCLREWARR